MSEKRKIQRFNLDEGRIWEAIEGLSPFKTTYTLEEVCEKLNEQQAAIEQLKERNVHNFAKKMQLMKEIKELKKEEKLYAKEIVRLNKNIEELNKTIEEALKFKSLGGNY